MNYGKRKFVLIIPTAIILTIIALLSIRNRYPQLDADINPHNDPAPVVENKKDGGLTATSAPTSNKLPSTLLLKVPFTPQAPTANWDELHNESCEEASAIMASEYFSGNKNTRLEPEFVEGQLSKITKWETENFGYYLDINTQEMSRLLEQFYGLKTKIITNYSEDDLKTELTQNHLLIFPANGQKLGNPNFRGSGPPYHVVVIKGYDGQGFITNDPGTKNGLNYPYSFSRLYSSNGDFNHTDHKVDLSKKIVLVVWK